MANTQGNFSGILAALVATLVFTLNDVGIKSLSQDYPLHEVVLIRALVGLLVTVLVLMPLDGGLQNMRTHRLGVHIIRGLCVVTANMTFFLALAAIPLFEATAIFFISPLLVTAFSVIFLKEHVGLKRWAAVGVGFLGVLIMLRPGTDAFRLAALLPVCAAVAYASLHTLTRKIRGTEAASTMAFYIQITFICVSAGMGLTVGEGQFAGSHGPSLEFLLRAWVWPAQSDFLIMIGVGVCSATGAYCISQAYRLCKAAVIAPFEYMSLVLAIIWGMTIFGERPDLIAWFGITLILGAGVYVFLRERQQNILKKSNPF